MRNILILGDSYSTFEGCIPEGYATYYPALDVTRAEQTWWSRVLRATGARLAQNNSWSGSTVCHTAYDGVDCSQTNSFICRYRKLKKEGFFEKNAVDTVLVFGGTNDSWALDPLGEMLFDEPKESDLFCVLPAICHLTASLKRDLPKAEIVLMINAGIKEAIQNTFEAAAAHYGVKSLRLRDIEKASGHPTANGMAQIAEQVLAALSCEAKNE